MEPIFTWSDTWLLFAIAVADRGKGATLDAIIGEGDGINCAIFTGPELRRGFAKIMHVGYVNERNQKFFLAGEAKKFWAPLVGSRKAVLTLMRKFESFLDVAPYPAGDPQEEDPHWTYPDITDELIHQAYEVYIARNRSDQRGKTKKSRT
jgi:hypothetical protein